MDTFDLYVKEPGNGDVDVVVVVEPVCEPVFGRVFGFAKCGEEVVVVRVLSELCEPVKVGFPACANGFRDECGKVWVGKFEPPPRCHPVGDVDDPFGVAAVEVREKVTADEVSVKG